MFEYKVGDKVRCKKFLHDKERFVRFYQGTEYEINSVWTITDPEESKNKGYMISVKNDGTTYIFDHPLKSLMKTKHFYDYFYSKKEMRKLKLTKINKNE